MFSPKSPKSLSKYVSKSSHGAGEQICMVECSCKPDCTCSVHSSRRHCAPEFKVGLQRPDGGPLPTVLFQSLILRVLPVAVWFNSVYFGSSCSLMETLRTDDSHDENESMQRSEGL